MVFKGESWLLPQPSRWFFLAFRARYSRSLPSSSSLISMALYHLHPIPGACALTVLQTPHVSHATASAESAFSLHGTQAMSNPLVRSSASQSINQSNSLLINQSTQILLPPWNCLREIQSAWISSPRVRLV